MTAAETISLEPIVSSTGFTRTRAEVEQLQQRLVEASEQAATEADADQVHGGLVVVSWLLGQDTG